MAEKRRANLPFFLSINIRNQLFQRDDVAPTRGWILASEVVPNGIRESYVVALLIFFLVLLGS